MKSTADILVYFDGSIGLVWAGTDAGRQWLDENVDPAAQNWAGKIAVEHRYLGPLLEGARDAGLTLGKG